MSRYAPFSNSSSRYIGRQAWLVLTWHALPPRQFQLRFSPALANKPKGPPTCSQDSSKPHKPFDPFASPPSSLVISDVGPSHYVLLNRFAIVPEHFILATRDFKEQTHVLRPSDLAATLACIQAYVEAASECDGASREGLFAFFNCGTHSGASQPHRHVQLLPIASMKQDLGVNSDWTVLADHIQPERLPFATFVDRISLDMSPSQLHDIYISLYRRACRAVAAHRGDGASADADADAAPAEGEAKISYNMAITREVMVVCPRLADGAELADQNGRSAGFLSLNGTVLAGTALVKNESEWEALRESPVRLLGALKMIGVPTDQLREELIKL